MNVKILEYLNNIIFKQRWKLSQWWTSLWLLWKNKIRGKKLEVFIFTSAFSDIHHFHISHNAPYLPPPPPPNFSKALFSISLGKAVIIKIMQNFGGQTRCIMGSVEVVYREREWMWRNNHMWIFIFRSVFLGVYLQFSGVFVFGSLFSEGGGGFTIFATTDLTAYETILNSLIIFPLHS